MAPAQDDAVKSLIEFAKAADLEELVWEKEGRRVAFKRLVDGAPAAGPAAAAPAPAEERPAVSPRLRIVTSPMVGTFWRAVSRDRPPLVVEGDEVTVGQRVAVVEAMKVPKDVISNVQGRITRIFVENGKPVEYGQKLFEVETE